MNKQIFSTLILAMMLAASAHAANQSQTLLRYSTDDGLIQTLPAVTVDPYQLAVPGGTPTPIKNAALLYDKRNPLPSLLMIGGNYAFFQGGLLATVDENGSLLFKGNVPYYPGTIGGNFFLNKGSNEVILIDSAGYYNSTGRIEGAIRLVGGNFYIDQAGVMTTIKHIGIPSASGISGGNSVGMMTRWDLPNQVVSDAIKAGGNYYEKVDGTVVTINSDGLFSMPIKNDTRPKKIGGNFFIGEDGSLYTISAAGIQLKYLISDSGTDLAPIIAKAKNFGYSYLIASDGTFIFIDGKGVPHTELVNVSTTGIKSELVHQLKGTLDTHQNFIQSEQP